MLDLGVFGHAYFELAIEEDYEGIRPSIVERLREQNGEPDWSKNCFGVKAGLDYAAWMENGWIFEHDPIGWFHWYMRFISGRRLGEHDEHQIKRYSAYARWYSRAVKLKAEGKQSKVINQGLLQWAWPVVV
jgi:hypothetical protein